MLRKTLFWAHFGVGLAAGIAILIMSLTGVLLAFEKQIVQFCDRDLRTVTTPSGARPRPISEMLSTVAASAHAAPSSVTLLPDPAAAVQFAIGRDRIIYVDPYTGAVLGEGSKPVREFFSVVERWHRTLGEPMGARGPLRAYAAAANLVFLLLVLSGLYLWFPRVWTWNTFRAGLWFRRGLKGKARDWNWHNATGFWCTLPLVLITFTGVVISYPWANSMLFRLSGSPVPSRGGPGGPGAPGGRDGRGPSQPVIQHFSADFDKAVSVAGAGHGGWRTISFRVPAPSDTKVGVTVDLGLAGEVEKKSQLVIDSLTGEVLKETGFADGSLGQRLRSLVRFTHTGEEAGLAGQLIAAIASAGGVFLVYTGFTLAYRRLRKSRT